MLEYLVAENEAAEANWTGDYTQDVGEVQMIAKRPAIRATRTYIDPSNGHFHVVTNKADTLKEIHDMQSRLAWTGIGVAGLVGLAATSTLAEAAAFAGFAASPWGVAVLVGGASLAQALVDYEQWVSDQPDNWESDVDLTGDRFGNDIDLRDLGE